MAELKIISMDEVQSKEVNWLWYPYIPCLLYTSDAADEL